MTPYLQERGGLHSYWNQITVFPVKMQDFKLGFGPIALVERSKDEGVPYMQNTL